MTPDEAAPPRTPLTAIGCGVRQKIACLRASGGRA